MTDTENVDPLNKKIIRQVEHYFGDFNLPRDKFLQEEVKIDDGWVTLEAMSKFNRLAELSTDAAVIVAALKMSKSGLIEVSEDGLKIRRDPKIPLPEKTEESRKALEARTVYAKGFDKENTVVGELLDHYNETNPDVVSIQMRNWLDKKHKEKGWRFKGSIFLTLKTEDAAKAFVESEEKYKDVTLIKKFQKDYLVEKEKEDEERRAKYGDRNGGDKKDEVELADIVLPKGSVMKLTGLGGEITREDIKEVLKTDFGVNIEKDGGDIAFITYEKGEAEAKIRFKAENAAKEPAAAWAAKEKVEIKGMTVVGALLEGEEEETFLADSARDLKNRRNKNRGGNNRGQKRRGGGGGYRGRGGKRGRR